MLEDIDIKKELIKSIISMVRHKEFYGHVVQQFEKVFVEGNHSINTAAVGRFPGDRFIKLIYNKDYFRGLYKEQFDKTKDRTVALKKSRLLASGATEHEILHVVFGHLNLTFDNRDRANIAFDCVVNQTIPDERRHESWIMPDRYGLPKDKNSKWYYDNLKNNEQFKKDMEAGMCGNPSHSLWKDLEDDPLAKEFIKDIIRKAKENTTSEGWGNLSGNIQEAIDDLLEIKPPKIPWERVLRNFCASSENSIIEYTMSRESRRFETRPGTRRRDLLSIGIIVDTSFSIDNEELKVFFNEIRWIWKKGADVHVFEADTDITNDYKFRGKYTGVVGRGGTCLETPLTKVDKMKKFDCIIYFTDFEAANILRKPKIPVLWVLSDPPEEHNWPCNWGTTIKIDVA